MCTASRPATSSPRAHPSRCATTHSSSRATSAPTSAASSAPARRRDPRLLLRRVRHRRRLAHERQPRPRRVRRRSARSPASTGWSSRRSGASSTTRRWRRCGAAAATWTVLDVLHREGLDRPCSTGTTSTGSTRARSTHMNRAWHRLDPWPDAVPGLLRLKTQVRDRAVFEREHRPDREHGEARRPAVGRGARRRAGACVQAGTGGVPRVVPHARSRARGGVDGGGAQFRPGGRARVRPANRIRARARPNATSSPIRTSTSRPTTSRTSPRSSTAETRIRGRRRRRRAETAAPTSGGRSRDAVFDRRRLVALGGCGLRRSWLPPLSTCDSPTPARARRRAEPDTRSARSCASTRRSGRRADQSGSVSVLPRAGRLVRGGWARGPWVHRSIGRWPDPNATSGPSTGVRSAICGAAYGCPPLRALRGQSSLIVSRRYHGSAAWSPIAHPGRLDAGRGEARLHLLLRAPRPLGRGRNPRRRSRTSKSWTGCSGRWTAC